MATLPPRKNPTPTKILTQNLSPLETLLQMGFTKQRAEKALVCTGHKGVQLAADWLLAHVRDPKLDETLPRDFIIYLCPVGELKEELGIFWQKSRLKFGWNGAHNSFPHITLTSSFKCPDTEVEALVRVITGVCDTLRAEEELLRSGERRTLRLERYMSPNFFGLFVEKENEALLKRLSADLCEEVRTSLGLKPEPILKSFHLTLAYQFQQKHFAGLEDLAEGIRLSDCGWQLRLYSYDSSTDGSEVHKVLFAHVPREPDELELIIGDSIYVTQEEMAKTTDGWVVGTSWLTGATGYLPANYVERTAETSTWTLHALVPLLPAATASAGAEHSSGMEEPAGLHCPPRTSSLERLVGAQELVHSSQENLCRGGGRGRESPAGLCDPGEEAVSSTTPTTVGTAAPRQLYVVRHGERVDFTFGLWIPYSFTKEGKYEKKDLNMPASVPERRAGPDGFARDCPLTVVGSLQASLLGQAMKEAGVAIHHVFCSPSLRCVQTCHGILAAMGVADTVKINLEPGLFEWLAWYQDGMPDWMSEEELARAGYNIQLAYKPYISAEELQEATESCQQFYIRNFFVTQCALQATEEMGGNVLVVGHSASLDTCTRQLVGRDPRPVSELMAIVRKVPYCSVSLAQEILPEDEDIILGPESPPHARLGGRCSPGGVSSASCLSRATLRSSLAPPPPREWRIVAPPFPPLTHTSVNTFDWKLLLDKK